MDFSGKYIFIRYNPDKFKDKYGKAKNPYFETRVEVLEKAIERHILRIQADDGPEFISAALDRWGYDNQLALDF
jgi:hypothetical protein